MRHGGEIDHERGGPEIVDRAVFDLRACGLHRCFKLGDGKLPVGLTEGNQSNTGSDQIGNVTLQESGQSRADLNFFPRQGNSENNRESRLDLALAEYFGKPVRDAVGPYLAQRREAGRPLLR